MPVGLLAVCFLVGAAVGSFLNVVIYRVPDDKSIVSPGSSCPNCGQAIRWWHNVPVLGWLMLGGKCADCRVPIPVRYPAIELAMGLIVAGLAWQFGPTVELLAWSVFAALLMVIVWIDIDHQLILDVITLPGIWLGLLYHVVVRGDGNEAILAAAFGYCFFWAIEHGSLLWLKQPGMGRGDAKFAALLGAWLGWPTLGMALFLSFLVGSIVGLGLLVARGASRYFPFGPSMAVGAVLALVWGQSLWDWYWGWLV